MGVLTDFHLRVKALLFHSDFDAFATIDSFLKSCTSDHSGERNHSLKDLLRCRHCPGECQLSDVNISALSDELHQTDAAPLPVKDVLATAPPGLESACIVWR